MNATEKTWTELDEIRYGLLNREQIMAMGYTKCAHPRKVVTESVPPLSSMELMELTPFTPVQRSKSYRCDACRAIWGIGTGGKDTWPDGILKAIAFRTQIKNP